MTTSVLSSYSLNKLRNHLSESKDVLPVIENFESIKDDLHLELIELDLEINFESSSLVLPNDQAKSRTDSDKTNIELVYSQISSITPAQATDERIWATLSLLHASKYTRCRWPLPEDPRKWGRHIEAHWLCSPAPRSRERDNSIGRLWWMGWLASQLDGWTLSEVAEILYNNSDYRQQLIDRKSSASALNVLSAILAISKEAFSEGIEFDRSNFRRFMKEVNHHALRRNLISMETTSLINMLRPVYRQCYGCRD